MGCGMEAALGVVWCTIYVAKRRYSVVNERGYLFINHDGRKKRPLSISGGQVGVGADINVIAVAAFGVGVPARVLLLTAPLPRPRGAVPLTALHPILSFDIAIFTHPLPVARHPSPVNQPSHILTLHQSAPGPAPAPGSEQELSAKPSPASQLRNR